MMMTDSNTSGKMGGAVMADHTNKMLMVTPSSFV